MKKLRTRIGVCMLPALAIAVSGCMSTSWRAKTLESLKVGDSEIFQVNEYQFNESIKLKKFRLSNGLKIIILEDHLVPVFAYHTWFNVGSRNERPGITGIAHLFEHLMFKETKTRKEGEYDRILEEQGGRINAATYFDWTFYRASVPTQAFQLVPELEADRLQNMILSDAQVNAEREVVANERRMRVDNSPGGAMYEKLYSTAFTVHTYHHPVIGWMKDIQSISTEECIRFHQTYYSPNNATIVVVGDVDTEETLKKINKEYGKIPPSQIEPQHIPPEPEQKAERRVEMKQPIPAEKIMIGFKSPDALSPELPPLELAHSVLFDGKSSRLYRKLISDLQIAAEAGGWVAQTKDPGLYIIDVTMKPNKKVEQAEEVIYQEMASIAENGIQDQELEKAKNRLETSFWRSFKTADDKAQAIGFYETTAKDYRRLFDEVERYRKVTKDQVQKAAQKYLNKHQRTVVIARPEGKTG